MENDLTQGNKGTNQRVPQTARWTEGIEHSRWIRWWSSGRKITKLMKSPQARVISTNKPNYHKHDFHISRKKGAPQARVISTNKWLFLTSSRRNHRKTSRRRNTTLHEPRLWCKSDHILGVTNLNLKVNKCIVLCVESHVIKHTIVDIENKWQPPKSKVNLTKGDNKKDDEDDIVVVISEVNFVSHVTKWTVDLGATSYTSLWRWRRSSIYWWF